MTLATRCSACGTSFRVVQDQLKVSGGWVRCGRCNEVFNAIEGLYEVGSPMAEPAARQANEPAPSTPETSLAPTSRVPVGQGFAPAAPMPPAAPPPEPAPPPPPPPPPPAPPPVPAVAATQAPAPLAADLERGAFDDDWQDSGDLPDLPPIAADTAPAPLASEPALDSSDAGPVKPPDDVDDHASAAIDFDAIDSHPPSELLGSTMAPDADDLLVPSPADEWQPGDWPGGEPTPSFLVAAERAAQRRRPRSRWAWGSACAVLLLLGVAQLALGYRDVVATRWPAAHPALQTACQALGCTVEPLRHIAALSVEASGLQQVGTASVYTLTVGLRNRSTDELLIPSLDLVLTDSMGRTIARRVLTMAELGRPSRTIAPGAETGGQVTLSTGEQRVSGYTIEIFYP